MPKTSKRTLQRQEWLDEAREALRAKKRKHMSPAQIKEYIAATVSEPYHPNVWGMFFSALVRGGELKPTGKTVKHQYKTQEVYRVA